MCLMWVWHTKKACHTMWQAFFLLVESQNHSITAKIEATLGRSAGPSPTWCNRTMPEGSIKMSPPRWLTSLSDSQKMLMYNDARFLKNRKISQSLALMPDWSSSLRRLLRNKKRSKDCLVVLNNAHNMNKSSAKVVWLSKDLMANDVGYTRYKV